MRKFSDAQIADRRARFKELEAKGLVALHPMPDGSAGLTFPKGRDHPEIAAFQAEAEALNSTVH